LPSTTAALRFTPRGFARFIGLPLNAALALVHRATLVTLNADDFGDIPGLRLAAW